MLHRFDEIMFTSCPALRLTMKLLQWLRPICYKPPRPLGPWRLDLATSLRKKSDRNAHNKQLQDSRQRTCKWHACEQFQTDWLRQQPRLQLFVNADKWSRVRIVQLQHLTQVCHYVSVDVTKSLTANVRLHCDIYEERLRAASWQTFTNEELRFTLLAFCSDWHTDAVQSYSTHCYNTRLADDCYLHRRWTWLGLLVKWTVSFFS